MKSSSDEQDNSNETWFADLADNLCPYYMSIGVSCSDYWFGDYTFLPFYEQAYESEIEETEYRAWLFGRYVYEAVGCLSPILHAFARKGTKPIDYPGEPHPATNRQLERLNEKKEALAAADEKKRQLSIIKAITGVAPTGTGKEEKEIIGRKRNRNAED
ncbi:MAG: hypothetical protein ACI3XQ_00500 [Eubacteriales bacterium]